MPTKMWKKLALWLALQIVNHFYAAFYKNIGETPNGYRKRHLEDKK